MDGRIITQRSALDTPSMPTHVYGAKLYGKFPISDFLLKPLKEPHLQIINVGDVHFSPIIIELAEKGSSAYSLKVKEAVKSDNLMFRLTNEDRLQLLELASLNPPGPVYRIVTK